MITLPRKNGHAPVHLAHGVEEKSPMHARFSLGAAGLAKRLAVAGRRVTEAAEGPHETEWRCGRVLRALAQAGAVAHPGSRVPAAR